MYWRLVIKDGRLHFLITDDLRLHLYKFVYNHPEFKSKSLGKIEGLDIVGNDIIKIFGKPVLILSFLLRVRNFIRLKAIERSVFCSSVTRKSRIISLLFINSNRGTLSLCGY